MTNQYKALPHHVISKSTKLNRRSTNRPTAITLDDSALLVMTDLNDTIPFSIEPTASINATNDKMIACGVRLLFVTNSDGILQGLVTATDVLGEKPVKYMTEHGGKYEDIICQDIMTPHSKLDALNYANVEKASIGAIVETLKIFQRQHILVTDHAEKSGVELIRGIFSTSQIGRQLGFRLEPTERANTFADLEQALMTG